jgi:uridine kinase
MEGSMTDNILVIGIAGGSGSGKTTLMKNLTKGFGDQITVLSHDNYYRAHDDLPFEQRSKLNYDHPDSFETDLMIEHLKELKAGRPIECPVYDYTIHNRTEETVTIVPKSVIIVEGILIFENKALCDLMDIKIFVDTDADVRLIRRIKRDVAKRGRSLESVLTQYLTTVKPMHEQFVEPSKKNADLVVLEGGKNLVALEMIMSQIRHHIDHNDQTPNLVDDTDIT